MLLKLLDIVINPNEIQPTGVELIDIVGDDTITFIDILGNGFIFLVCGAVLFLAIREIISIKNEKAL